MTLLSNIWAMEPQALRKYMDLYDQLQQLDLSQFEARDGVQMQARGGVAVIPVVGPLAKNLGLIEEILGFASTDQITSAVEEAAADDAISEIVLRIDSPGGSVSGMADLTDAIYSARERKTVTAQIDGQAASAGYDIASQASQIFIGREDIVGSIGVRLMLYDFSQAFEQEGIEAVPIDTGQFKSAGAMGTEITQEQREDFQRVVNQFFEGFVTNIMRGRDMSESAVREVADGRIFVGQEGVDMGLVDGVQTFRETMNTITERNRRGRSVAANRVRVQAPSLGVTPSRDVTSAEPLNRK